MKAPGTLAFLVRWHFVPFFGGLAVTAFAAYQLWSYQGLPAMPTGLNGVATAPAADLFVPMMWVGLCLGLFMMARAYFKASAAAHG